MDTWDDLDDLDSIELVDATVNPFKIRLASSENFAMDETNLQMTSGDEIDVKFRIIASSTLLSDSTKVNWISSDFVVIFKQNCRAAFTASNEQILIGRTINIGKELEYSSWYRIKNGFDESSDRDFCVRPHEGMIIRIAETGQTYDALQS